MTDLIGDNYILGGLNHRELRVTSQDVKVIIATVSILLLINFFYTLFIENYNARHKTFTEWEAGRNWFKPDQTGSTNGKTGLIRITFKSYTVQNCHSDCPCTCRPNDRPSEHHLVVKNKQARGKIKNISIIYLFIILNILARVRITKIGIYTAL